MHDTSANYDFRLGDFATLRAAELYACLRLRAAVFVVEQACAYQDLDGLDAVCRHLRLESSTTGLAGYARLVPPGVDFERACAIGRVVVDPGVRGHGLGRRLVRRAIGACRAAWPDAAIRIRAQTYLLRFYGELGFVAEGEPYLEDGIPHRTMRFAGGG